MQGEDIMLICYNCGTIFDESDIKYEAEPHGEYRGHCPCCLDEHFGEAEWCSHCNDYFFPHQMAGKFCGECKSDLLKRLRAAASKELYADERDYLECELELEVGTLGR